MLNRGPCAGEIMGRFSALLAGDGDSDPYIRRCERHWRLIDRERSKRRY